ncbi:MAG: hypothetical protein MJ168_08135 [Clostridia bacterium]|nr:hypothetical protein [Clostridia bacterium]
MNEADKAQVLQLAARLYAATQKKKANDSKFTEFKKSVEGQLDVFISTGESVTIDGAINQGEMGVYTITNVQPTSITWFADKLKEKLDKAIYKRIINRRYEIADYEGLVKYLKSCGVDPKVFKSFVNVVDTVDTKKIDNMSKLGYIPAERIAGCYLVEMKNPYYKVSFRKQ